MYSLRLQELMDYAVSNNRVCPMPEKWNELWKTLSKEENLQGAFKLAPPLILAAWHESTDQEKILRLKEQLIFAEQQGLIDQAESFLHGLNETHWYHSGGGS